MTSVKSNLSSIQLLPIRALTLISGDQSLALYQLESESNYQVAPILRINDEGMPIAVAYKFNATIYLPHNEPEMFYDYFIGTCLNKPIKVVLSLGNYGHWEDGNIIGGTSADTIDNNLITKVINATGGAYIHTDQNAYITQEFESIEFRFRRILRISCKIRNIYNNLHFTNYSVAENKDILIKRTLQP